MDKDDSNSTAHTNLTTTSESSSTSSNTHQPSVVDLAEQFNVQANFEAESGASGMARQQDSGLSVDTLARRRARKQRRLARQRKQREQEVAASRAQRVFGREGDAAQGSRGIGGGVGETDEMLSGMLERLERRMEVLRSGVGDGAGVGMDSALGNGDRGQPGLGRFASAAAEFGLSGGGAFQDVWGEPGENDEEMQRILAESYQSSKPASSGNEEDDLRRAIEASLKEQAPVEASSGSTSPTAELGENVNLEDKDLLEKLKAEDEIARKIIEEGVAAEAKLERQRQESATEKMLLDAQLESIRDTVEAGIVDETRRIFLEMRDKSKRDGGRPADFELALSMAQDQAKDRKKQAEREEEEVIERRQNESRKARAKRFAEAMEKKLQAKKEEEK